MKLTVILHLVLTQTNHNVVNEKRTGDSGAFLCVRAISEKQLIPCPG